MSASTTVDELRFCTFRLGELHFGVPVTEVQEVIRAQQRTRVPLVSAVVNGLINLRGEIVTTIDLRRRMDLPPLEGTKEPMNVVIRSDGDVVSILVDEIDDVLELDASEFEEVPTTLQGKYRDLVTGVFKLNGHLLLALDPGKLLDIQEADMKD